MATSTSMSGASALAGFNPNNTIGAMFLGCVFAALLYGITVLQIYIYYKKYPKDYSFHKIMVAVLWALDSVHLAFAIAATHHYVIQNFGKVQELQELAWPLKVQIAFNAIIVMVVQVLYAIRVWKLGRHYNWTVPISVAAIVVIGWGCALMLIIRIAMTPNFVRLNQTPWVVYIPLSVLTAIDAAIASSMCIYLTKSKTGFDRTNNMIFTIMRMTLATGCVTSACSLTVLVTYSTMKNNMIFLGIEFLLTKLYVLSYVSLLTARHPSNYTSDSQAGPNSGVSLSKIVNIQTTTTTHVDGEDPPLGTSDDKNSIPLSPISQSSKNGPTRVRHNSCVKWDDDANSRDGSIMIHAV